MRLPGPFETFLAFRRVNAHFNPTNWRINPAYDTGTHCFGSFARGCSCHAH